MSEFEILGAGVPLASGMCREPEDGKVDYLLVRDGPIFKRWAQLLTRAIPVRGRRNWMLANSEDDLERFRRSACRHFEQWLAGDDDEDHAAAVVFNVNGVEYVRDLLRVQAEGGEAATKSEPTRNSNNSC